MLLTERMVACYIEYNTSKYFFWHWLAPCEKNGYSKWLQWFQQFYILQICNAQSHRNVEDQAGSMTRPGCLATLFLWLGNLFGGFRCPEGAFASRLPRQVAIPRQIATFTQHIFCQISNPNSKFIRDIWAGNRHLSLESSTYIVSIAGHFLYYKSLHQFADGLFEMISAWHLSMASQLFEMASQSWWDMDPQIRILRSHFRLFCPASFWKNMEVIHLKACSFIQVVGLLLRGCLDAGKVPSFWDGLSARNSHQKPPLTGDEWWWLWQLGAMNRWWMVVFFTSMVQSGRWLLMVFVSSLRSRYGEKWDHIWAQKLQLGMSSKTTQMDPVD